MSLLDQIIESKPVQFIFAIPYGPDGTGKTTLGANAPSPVFIRTEAGTAYVRDADGKKIKHFPDPKTFSDILSYVDELLTRDHSYKTLVLDTLDHAEPLCHAEVCKEMGVKMVSEAPYGKGYEAALKKWQVLFDKLKQLRSKMNVILIAHSIVRKAQDPINATEYDRHEIKLHAKAASLARESVDAVLFCTYEVFTKKEGMKTRAFGDGARVMYTQWRPSHDAKNRMGLPYQLDLSWDALSEAMQSDGHDIVTNYKSEIAAMLTQLKDEELKKIVTASIEKAGDNASQLNKISNRLRLKLEV